MATLLDPADVPCDPTPLRGLYRAFGLVLESDIPLPELTPAEPDARPDLRIALTTGGPLPSREEGVVATFADDGRHFLAWPDVAAFQFHGIDRIDVEPYPGTPLNYLPFPLLGPIMALALHMRGLLTLHASAIEVNGRAAIFVGDKLAGKSTTAAAFLRAGHRLLTDDLLAIDFSTEEGPRIRPAYGQLKLAEDAAEAIRIDQSEPLPLVYPAFEKRQHRLTDPFSHEGLAPGHIYVLDRGGGEPALTRFAGPDALRAIMRYSYITRFGRQALNPVAEMKHMQACAALGRAAQVATLHVPHDLARLDEVVALVAADCAGAA